MLALRTSASEIAATDVARVAVETFRLDAAAERLAGERDDNFLLHANDGSRYVLKLIDPADSGAAELQVRVLRHLAERDPSLPVPRLRATRSGADSALVATAAGPRTALVVSHLPGRHWPPAGDAAPSPHALGALLARLDWALEGFHDPALAKLLAWDVRRLPDLLPFADHIEGEVGRRLAHAAATAFAARLPVLDALRAQAIHGDCHAGNLLLDEAGRTITGILDFGDMIRAPLVFEPAVAMAEALSEGIAALPDLEALIAGYASRLRLQAIEVDSLFDLVVARCATTMLVHAWRRRHDPRGAAALERAAARAAGAIENLFAAGREALTRSWHAAAGTWPADRELRRRRASLMGAHAELFYSEPLSIVRGEDVWLIDAAGRRYLDVYNNVPHVGHAHPSVVDAIARQTATLATNTRYLHPAILDYAEQLTSRLPPGLDVCVFVNSGSEANDVAWRIAQSATGRSGALIMEHAYHGITDAVSALTPAAGARRDPRVETLSPPPDGPGAAGTATPDWLARVDADLDRAVAALAARRIEPAAFFLDSGLTSNGILDPPPAWANRIGRRVRAAGGLVVADEVQYGLGRSGSHFWGFMRRGLEPDMVTLGKPVGNGFPLGVVVTRRELLEPFQRKYGFFSTFGGNAVAAAAGLAVLDVLERERLVENAQTTGAHWRARLEDIVARRPVYAAARGAGLLIGLEVAEIGGVPAAVRARRIVDALAARHRVLTGLDGPGGNVLKLRPPLTFRPQHADLAADAIDSVAAADEAGLR